MVTEGGRVGGRLIEEVEREGKEEREWKGCIDE